MPVALDGPCRVMDLREGDALTAGPLRVWRHVGRESGAAAVSLRVLDLASGASAGLRNADCEEVLFVPTSGQFVLRGLSVSLRGLRVQIR